MLNHKDQTLFSPGEGAAQMCSCSLETCLVGVVESLQCPVLMQDRTSNPPGAPGFSGAPGASGAGLLKTM